MTDLPSLLPTVLAVLFKSAANGTLIEIVETAAKLGRLLQPLMSQLPVQGANAAAGLGQSDDPAPARTDQPRPS